MHRLLRVAASVALLFILPVISQAQYTNLKIQSRNEIAVRAFKAGNEASKAGNYDRAIAAYEEGLNTARDEPALLTNLSEALRRRGAVRFDKFINNKDESAKEAAYRDWRRAADAANEALVIMGAGATDQHRTQNKLAAHKARAAAMKFVGTKVDRSQADAAFMSYQEYIAAETNAAKKSSAQFDAANIFFEVESYDRAAAEFRKTLDAYPTNTDAHFKLGSALIKTGDKSKYQEAANHLARFREIAPATNPLQAEAKSLLQLLNEKENIKPSKVETPRTGRRG